MLKGLWAVDVARHLGRDRAGQPVSVLDPFCGAPAYPLVPATAERLAGAPLADALRAAWSPWLAQGLLASTAALVLETLSNAGARPTARVFDSDEMRRASWAGRPGIEVLELTDGGAALETGPPADLVLVDPYDLLERFEALVPPALATHGGILLLYVYNTSPRGAPIHKRYLGLRELLQRRLAEEGAGRHALVGRVPSDAVLPRAFHEMILVAPRDVTDALADELQRDTATLAAHLAGQGCFERPS